jgi:thioredoxin reductase (NADPH)
MVYDCIIIGGGIAGLQAAIQLGRYQRRVLVVDSNRGRSTLCRSYHNLLGWPDGVSGEHLRSLGRNQAENLGVEFAEDEIIRAEKNSSAFELTAKSNTTWQAKSLLLATGVSDRIPVELFPMLAPCLGLRIYVCPDCDGYETRGHRTVIMGSGDTGAQLALTLTSWTKEIYYINHEQKPVGKELLQTLSDKGIAYFEEPIRQISVQNEWDLQGVVLQNGTTLEAERGFIAFGGNEVNTALAKQLGVERMENNHLMVDPRTKQTNVPMVWAAGDIVAHSEQVAIAMGDGIQSAIWIHKKLN